MKTLKIEINLLNADFGEDGGVEVARILRRLADHCENTVGILDGRKRLMDTNGNTCGEAEIV